MLAIRTAAQIRGARSVKSFRSCAVSTGVLDRGGDISRVLRAAADLENSESRRRRLAASWDARQGRGR